MATQLPSSDSRDIDDELRPENSISQRGSSASSIHGGDTGAVSNDECSVYSVAVSIDFHKIDAVNFSNDDFSIAEQGRGADADRAKTKNRPVSRLPRSALRLTGRIDRIVLKIRN
jgi:hypothetical protein